MSALHFRQATREEFGIAVEWAAEEGWNPGLDDADVFWNTDPKGQVVAERDGEVVATGSIVSYGQFGFMGFFIVGRDQRGKGIGREFWHWRKGRLEERLDEGAPIGMDGVFEMRPFYAKGGFEFSHRNLRMEGVGRKVEATTIPEGHRLTDVRSLPFEALLDFDRDCFGVKRRCFLEQWIDLEHGKGLAVVEEDDSLGQERIVGYGVIRRCRRGWKIGPLFSEDTRVAHALFDRLQVEAIGQPVFLDVPENHPAARALAERAAMEEVFGCARMYAGSTPEIPWDWVYGVTTFELG